jgi:hypothetical protein
MDWILDIIIIGLSSLFSSNGKRGAQNVSDSTPEREPTDPGSESEA